MTRQHHPDDVAAAVKAICAAREKCWFPGCTCEKEAGIVSEGAIPVLTAIVEAHERRGLVLVPLEPTREMLRALLIDRGYDPDAKEETLDKLGHFDIMTMGNLVRAYKVLCAARAKEPT